jgi:hypothetical protein
MTHRDFMIKLAELHMELSKAVIDNDFSEIEHWSKRIGRLIARYLDENKMYVDRS